MDIVQVVINRTEFSSTVEQLGTIDLGEAAKQIKEMHFKASNYAKMAISYAIETGIMLLRVRECGRVNGFWTWVTGSVGIPRGSASRYINLAESVVGGSVSEAVENGTVDEVIEHASEKLDGKRLTEVYEELGIVKRRDGGKRGGARDGAGRPPRTALDLAKDASALLRDPALNLEACDKKITDLWQWGIEEDGFHSLTTENLNRAKDLLIQMLEAVEKAIEAKKAEYGVK